MSREEADPWGFQDKEWNERDTSKALLDLMAKKDASRDGKWAAMTHHTLGLEKMSKTSRSRGALKRRVRKGVPRAWRKTVWPALLETSYGSDRRPNAGAELFREEAGRRGIKYVDLVKRSAGPCSPDSIYDVVERDLTRTYPRHRLFETAIVDGGGSDRSVEVGGVSMLRRLLRAYAALDAECGYCQGMNYVAALLLIHVGGTRDESSRNDPLRTLSKRKLSSQKLLDAGDDAAPDPSGDGDAGATVGSRDSASFGELEGTAEEDCFWLFVAALRSRRTRLRGLYLPGMVGCRRALYVYSALLAKHAPGVHRHLAKEGIDPNMFATHWFVTIFCAQFPYALVTRVWDMFLAEGWKPVYRVAVALLAANDKALLALDFEGLMTWLRLLPDTVDVAKTLKVAAKLKLTTDAVAALEANFDAEDKGPGAG